MDDERHPRRPRVLDGEGDGEAATTTVPPAPHDPASLVRAAEIVRGRGRPSPGGADRAPGESGRSRPAGEAASG
jgi:hypothetical protein